ncbi:MAG: hypothetical protein AB7S72_19230 [Draconibacterium sp.]
MKKSIKIIAVLAITTIYCFAIGVVSSSVILVNSQVKPKSEQTAFISTASVNLFNYLNQKENRLNSQVQLQIKDFKEPISELSINTKVISQLFKREIRQYFKISVQLLIQKKVSILIFPFNYFW